MINFFRKIRRKFADNNQFFKYSRYAIGEIVLVVVGILIALQINNLNEASKINLLEKDLLREVKNGLEHDLDQLKNAIDFHRLSLKSQDIIVDWVNGNINYNDSLGFHFLRTVFNSNLRFKEAPYETLQQIGLQIVKNDSLRNQISSLYDLVYQDLNWWQEDYEKIKSRFRNSFTELGFESEGSERIGNSFVPIDTLKLKNDKTYIFDLKVIRANLAIFTDIKMTNGLHQIEKTIEMIDKEIEEK